MNRAGREDSGANKGPQLSINEVTENTIIEWDGIKPFWIDNSGWARKNFERWEAMGRGHIPERSRHSYEEGLELERKMREVCAVEPPPEKPKAQVKPALSGLSRDWNDDTRRNLLGERG